MTSTLTLASTTSLLLAMIVLAAIPSSSVLLVTSRASTFGARHGVYAALGVVAGDIFFVLLAVYGLAAVVERWSWAFDLFQLLSGLYLLLLGTQIWRSRRSPPPSNLDSSSTKLSSFAAGLMLTLADQKAVFFYLAFFPAFFDIRRLTHVDVGVIALVTLIGVGGVKVAYALSAARLGSATAGRGKEIVAGTAGVMMLLVGTYLVASGLHALASYV